MGLVPIFSLLLSEDGVTVCVAVFVAFACCSVGAVAVHTVVQSIDECSCWRKDI
jgi:hypothetical protein